MYVHDGYKICCLYSCFDKVCPKKCKSVRDNAERYPINFNKSSESINASTAQRRLETAGNMDSGLLLKFIDISQTTFRHCRVRFTLFWTTFVETAVYHSVQGGSMSMTVDETDRLK